MKGHLIARKAGGRPWDLGSRERSQVAICSSSSSSASVALLRATITVRFPVPELYVTETFFMSAPFGTAKTRWPQQVKSISWKREVLRV